MRRNDPAFTIIELLVVVTIIVVLLAMLTQKFSGPEKLDALFAFLRKKPPRTLERRAQKGFLEPLGLRGFYLFAQEVGFQTPFLCPICGNVTRLSVVTSCIQTTCDERVTLPTWQCDLAM